MPYSRLAPGTRENINGQAGEMQIKCGIQLKKRERERERPQDMNDEDKGMWKLLKQKPSIN